NLQPQRLSRGLGLFHRERRDDIGCIPKDGHPGEPGYDLLEQLQSFPTEVRTDIAQPGDVSSRSGEAGHESGPDRVAGRRHDDRDRARCVLGSQGPERPPGHDDVHLEPDQLGYELGEPLGPPLSKSVFEDDVLALDVAKLAQLLSERLSDWVRRAPSRSPLFENTDPGDLPLLLCTGDERSAEGYKERQQEAAAVRQDGHADGVSRTFSVLASSES